YSVATGLLVPISYVVFALIAKLAEGGPAGLIERLGIFAGGMWVVLLALRLIRKPAPRIHIA
ncbi:hypothetical protein, partial [Nocardia farcinica]